jgi:hypothetical protein
MKPKPSQDFTEALSAQYRRDAERVGLTCDICIEIGWMFYEHRDRRPDESPVCDRHTPEYNRLMELSRKYTWRTGWDVCPACGGTDRRLVGTSNLGPIYAQNHSLKCDNVNHKRNPQYTIEPVEGYESLVAILKERGEEEFEDYLWNKVIAELSLIDLEHLELTKSDVLQIVRNIFAEILQTPELLMKSIMSFWNQREVGK